MRCGSFVHSTENTIICPTKRLVRTCIFLWAINIYTMGETSHCLSLHWSGRQLIVSGENIVGQASKSLRNYRRSFPLTLRRSSRGMISRIISIIVGEVKHPTDPKKNQCRCLGLTLRLNVVRLSLTNASKGWCWTCHSACCDQIGCKIAYLGTQFNYFDPLRAIVDVQWIWSPCLYTTRNSSWLQHITLTIRLHMSCTVSWMLDFHCLVHCPAPSAACWTYIVLPLYLHCAEHSTTAHMQVGLVL